MPKIRQIVPVAIPSVMIVLPTGIAWIMNLGSTLLRLGGIDLGIQNLKLLLLAYGMSYLILDIVTVDLSTVTTFLLLVTAVLITSGVKKVYRRTGAKSSIEDGDKIHFPFWPTYKTTFVQLGLLGTLFAFIIAFSQARTPAAASSVPATDTLMAALGTALWSTFSAILLAFVLCPLVEMPFRKALNRDSDNGKNDSVDEDVESISNTFNALRERISLTNSAFDNLTGAIKNLGGADELDQFMRTVKKNLSDLDIKLTQLEQGNKNVVRSLSDLEERLSNLTQGLAQLGGAQREVEKNHQLIENKLSDLKEGLLRSADRLSVLEKRETKYEKLKKHIMRLVNRLES